MFAHIISLKDSSEIETIKLKAFTNKTVKMVKLLLTLHIALLTTYCLHSCNGARKRVGKNKLQRYRSKGVLGSSKLCKIVSSFSNLYTYISKCVKYKRAI